MDFYQDIADNARAALDCPGVQVWRYLPSTQEIEIAAWSGLQLAPSQRALNLIQCVFPSFKPLEYKNSVQLNDFLRKVYIDGETQTATFAKAAERVAPLLAIWIAGFLARMRFTLTVPIKIEQQVVAGISFIRDNSFTPSNLKTCEAFARQAALLLENATLTENLSEQLHHLQYSRRLLSQNEERLRRDISELLHTRVQTRLLMAWHRLGEYQQLETETQKNALIEQIQGELERIREQDVRQASHMLHPSVIRIGLIPALRSLAARVSGVLEVKVEADQSIIRLDTAKGNQINENLRLVAYRVIEEALANTLRHARAKTLWIRITVIEQLLELEVQDDGIGFEQQHFVMGLGLSSIAARVLSSGGTWKIASQLGSGTILTALIPL
jgi:signal transduction histidine kinase